LKTIDLHGNTLHNAWKRFITFAYEKSVNKEKHIRVITGQGAIAKEFPQWCDANAHVRSCKTEPHNLGSWEVKLR
jgi:DNA-nicking Smr family endonuclease